MDEWLIPFFYLIVPLATLVLYRRMGPPQYRPQNRRRQREADPDVMAQIDFGENLALPDPDELDKWEVLAIHWLHEGRELSAIELVQRQTGLDFEAAKVKLYKLEEEENS